MSFPLGGRKICLLAISRLECQRKRVKALRNFFKLQKKRKTHLGLDRFGDSQILRLQLHTYILSIPNEWSIPPGFWHH